MGGNAVRLGALFGGPLLLIAMHGRWRRPVLPMVGVLVALGVWQWSRGGARLRQAGAGPRGALGVLGAAAAVPGDAARPAADRGPVHAQPLGERRDRDGRPARARLAAAARHRPQPDLLQGRDQPGQLRELAVGQRRPLRGAADRQARQVELPRARADRERAALPQAALAVRGLPRLRGHASDADRDSAGRRPDQPRAVRLRPPPAARGQAGRRDRQGAPGAPTGWPTAAASSRPATGPGSRRPRRASCE